MDLQTVKDLLAQHHPDADLALIDAAYEMAAQAHRGQYRETGEEYITHPVAVAGILAKLQLDAETVAAGLLHDVVEDTGVTLADLEQKFGAEIAGLVDGVTKLEKLQFSSREEAQVENLRKMFLAMARDLRVILIKLADRFHNMQTIKIRHEAAQLRVAQETMEIYAPLAHRLGIYELKWELEDLAFRVLDPEGYRETATLIARRRSEREALVAQLISELQQKLAGLGIKADISGRPKHIYSLYKKLQKGRDITEIYDLIAIRIIVDEVKDCYGILGVIHSAWRPLPGRFKDYIATPKANLYQSLHTSVIGPHGEPFEIQIRTWDMHRTAEYGFAAHWAYKEGRPTNRDFDRRLSWLRGLLEWHTEMREAREFVEAVKSDIFTDQVFVFTPKGHVVNLPAGATPIDFAYAIHTEVGHRCVGAKVSGRIVPLDSELHSGDIVEVLTSKNSPGPSPDWLKSIKTSGAKNKIRQFFKRERREENLELGKDMLEREIKRLGFDPHELLRDAWVEEIGRRYNISGAEELYVAIGVGTLTAGTVAARLKDQYDKEQARQKGPETTLPAETRKDWAGYGRASSGIRVKGIDNVLIRYSRCCNPVPGDPIIGYVTRGRGVTVHRLDCPNMNALSVDTNRMLEVAWEDGYSAAHPVEIQFTALDRPGLLAEATAIIADSRINVLTALSRTNRNKIATIELMLEVRDLNQLQYVLQKIRKIRDVLSVERVVREARTRGGVVS